MQNINTYIPDYNYRNNRHYGNTEIFWTLLLFHALLRYSRQKIYGAVSNPGGFETPHLLQAISDPGYLFLSFTASMKE